MKKDNKEKIDWRIQYMKDVIMAKRIAYFVIGISGLIALGTGIYQKISQEKGIFCYDKFNKEVRVPYSNANWITKDPSILKNLEMKCIHE